jgi:hypothetical protein
VADTIREAVIAFEFLQGWQNQTVAKELCVASANTSENFRFKCPYKMAVHSSSEHGINWADSHIMYRDLHKDVTVAVAGFSHFYTYRV